MLVNKDKAMLYRAGRLSYTCAIFPSGKHKKCKGAPGALPGGGTCECWCHQLEQEQAS